MHCATLAGDHRITQFIIASIFSSHDANKEAGLFISWYLLRESEAVDQDRHALLHNALCQNFEENISLVSGMLSADVPVQLQMNLIGLLAHLFFHDGIKGGAERLQQVAISMGQPSILRKLLLSMVQVCG